jgi:histidinol-phosphate phosphatase family protein
MINQFVIVAGGEGTRLKKQINSKPKILLEIFDKSLLELYFARAVEFKIKKILLLLCKGASEVMAEVKNLKTKYNVEVDFSVEPESLGTGGAIRFALDKLDDEFLLFYGDIYFNINLNKYLNFFEINQESFAIFTHPNSHVQDSDIIEVDDDELVVKLHRKPHRSNLKLRNNVSSGLYLFKKDIFKINSDVIEKFDLDKDFIPFLISTFKRGRSIRNIGTIRDLGTPERLTEFRKKKELLVKSGAKPAIFLDRDGTLNKINGYISNPNQFFIYPDVPGAIKEFNDLGYWVFVVTNQPVVARGVASPDQIRNIHAKLDFELSNFGAFVDDYFICFHHPDSGFIGENIDYKIECNCRKPRIGLIEKALEKYPIELKDSLLIGDTWRDQELAKNFQLDFYKICREGTLSGDKNEVTSLLQVVQVVMHRKNIRGN